MGIETLMFFLEAVTALTLFGAGFMLQVSFSVAKNLTVRLLPLYGAFIWAIFLIIKAEFDYLFIFSAPLILGVSAALLRDFFKKRKA